MPERLPGRITTFDPAEGMSLAPKPRKIAMVGTAQSRQGAPTHLPDWEIFGVSSRGTLARADRWYEIHPIDVTFDKEGEADKWRAEVKKFCSHVLLEDDTSPPVPIHMLFPEPDLGQVVTMDEVAIRARFDSYHLTSTFSWMFADALMEICPLVDGVPTLAPPGTHIAIYGVDMEYGSEYSDQRQGFRTMISIARALGIEVHRTLTGGLIYEPVPYPHWQLDPLLCKLEKRNKEARETLSARDEALQANHEMIASVRGSLAEAQMAHTAAILAPLGTDEEKSPVKPYEPMQRIAHLERQLDDLTRLSSQLSKDVIAWGAVDSEQTWLKGYLTG